jgi:hypothetical protein
MKTFFQVKPTEIALPTKLTTLIILSTNHGIHGPVTSEIGKSVKARVTTRSRGFWTQYGTIPNKLANLSSVEHLYFNNDSLTGMIPRSSCLHSLTF